MAHERDCLVIGPIGDPDSETRKRSDQILKHVITPAVIGRGFTPIRADKLSDPGMITSHIIKLLVSAPLVIADLSERNPNVFYELALRHAARRPLIQLIKKGEQVPFDVAGMRTIAVDHHDLDSVEEARVEIVKQMDASLRPGALIETPVQTALQLQALHESKDPQNRMLATILEELAHVRAATARLEEQRRRMSTPTNIVPAEAWDPSWAGRKW